MNEIRPTLLILPATILEFLGKQKEASGEAYADLAIRYIEQGLETDGVFITEQEKEAIAEELALEKVRRSHKETWDDIAEEILRGAR